MIKMVKWRNKRFSRGATVLFCICPTTERAHNVERGDDDAGDDKHDDDPWPWSVYIWCMCVWFVYPWCIVHNMHIFSDHLDMCTMQICICVMHTSMILILDPNTCMYVWCIYSHNTAEILLWSNSRIITGQWPENFGGMLLREYSSCKRQSCFMFWLSDWNIVAQKGTKIVQRDNSTSASIFHASLSVFVGPARYRPLYCGFFLPLLSSPSPSSFSSPHNI